MLLTLKDLQLIVVASCFAMLAGFVFGKEDPEMKYYDYEITRIIDGDTVAFQADFLPEPLKQELSIRVYGVDTPEKGWRGQCDKEKQMGEAASKFTKQQIETAKEIKVGIAKWDKFGG